MLAVQKTSAEPGLTLAEIPEPGPPRAGEVIVEVGAAGICGSDVHIYEWKGSSYAALKDKMPITLGHEFAGRIVAAGQGVVSPQVGDRVTAVPLIDCGTCAACLTGKSNECTTPHAIGLTLAGCFARYVRLPARACLVLPSTVSDERGALIEPLTIAANAVATGQIGAGHRVLIQGAGPIAQGMAIFARSSNAREIIITGMKDARRLAVFRQLGFDHLIDLADTGAAQQLIEATKDGFDVVLEATGAPATIEQGLQTLKRGGVLVSAGIHPESATFDVTRLVRRRLQIRGSYSAPVQVWRQVIAALAAQPNVFSPIITHRLPLDRALEGFLLAQDREASKVILLPR